MKKSGFEDTEIQGYKQGRLRGENEPERIALEAMESAKEAIVKQYRGIKSDYIEMLRLHMSTEKIWSMITQKYGLSDEEFDKFMDLL